MKLVELRKLAENGNDEAKMEYMMLIMFLKNNGIEIEEI